MDDAIGAIVGYDWFNLACDVSNPKRIEINYTDGGRVQLDTSWPYMGILGKLKEARGREISPPPERVWRAFRGAIKREAVSREIVWSE